MATSAKSVWTNRYVLQAITAILAALIALFVAIRFKVEYKDKDRQIRIEYTK